MNVSIDLPDDLGAALKAKASALGISVAGFTRRLLEDAVKPAQGEESKPKKSGYGLLAKYGPGPSAEEIDQNRHEIFRGFAQDAP